MTAKPPIYLDYAATTPVDLRVAESMAQCLSLGGVFGNPASSTHVYGEAALQAVEAARAQVAGLIQADPRAIIWTSGATEANNLAIQGAARFNQAKGRHIVTLKTEHKAVLDPCMALAEQGFEVQTLPVLPTGLLDLATFEAALRDDTILVSVMHVNNELGVIQNIEKIAAITQARGILLHVDAAQSAGKIAIDVTQIPVDLLSLSAHKMYGPKGVGALYVRRQPRARLQAIMHGGGHEQGLRPGTLATHQIVGMGEAAALAQQGLASEPARIQSLRDQFWQGLQACGEVTLNASLDNSVPHILNVCFANIDAEALLAALPQLAASLGSACTSAQATPSHVLKALGCSAKHSQASVRFSLGRFTTADDVTEVVAAICKQVKHLRAQAPLWQIGADASIITGAQGPSQE